MLIGKLTILAILTLCVGQSLYFRIHNADFFSRILAYMYFQQNDHVTNQ